MGWMLGEFPDAGLILVECADGRWFVGVDHDNGNDRFGRMPGLSRPNVVPHVEPILFADEASAMGCALECIKIAYPSLAGRDLHQCAVDYFGD